MKIEVLGVGCPKCKKLYENTQAVVKELNIEAEILKVEDIEKIVNYGIMMTPAIALDGKIISTGKVLSKDEIRNIIAKK